MSSINVNYVYVNDVNAPYGASVQVIQETSGDVFTLGPVAPDGTACYALKGTGFAPGQTFTVTIQAYEGGAAADLTVITYDPNASAAAKYSGSGSLKNPSLQYIGKGPAPHVTINPPPSEPIKVNMVYVDDSKAPYNASIQLIHCTSGDVFPLGKVGLDSTSWYSLKDVVGLTAGQTFTVTLQADQGGAMADPSVITYDPGAAFAAAYSGTGTLKQPIFNYVDKIPNSPPPPPSQAIKVNSVVVDDSLNLFPSFIQAIATDSGASYILGSMTGISTGLPNKFPLQGKLPPGQTFTVTLVPDSQEYGPMPTHTVITYDPSVSAAANYALQLNPWGPEFDYWPWGF